MRILIQNGTVVKSTGRRRADVLIENGRIARIAPHIDAAADRVIDAEGCFIFAGFIDTHTHFDLDLGQFRDRHEGGDRRRHDDGA